MGKSGQPMPFSVGLHSIYNINIDSYNRELNKHFMDYSTWLKERQLLEKINAHSFRLSVWLTNSGRAPADDLDLTLDFPAEIVSVTEQHDASAEMLVLRKPPVPPEKPTHQSIDGFRTYADLIYPKSSLDFDIDHDFHHGLSVNKCEDGKRFRVTFSAERLKHHQNVRCGVLVLTIQPDAIRPFQASYKITAANLPQQISGSVPIVVKKRESV